MRAAFVVFILLFAFQLCKAQTNNTPLRTVLGVGGSSTKVTLGGTSYWVQQSIGQSGAIGTFRHSNTQLFQGFIQPLHSLKKKSQPPLLVAVYPNPFNNRLTLEFPDEVTGSVMVRVTDILGREVYKNEFDGQPLILFSLGDLARGQYLLMISVGGKQQHTKLIRE